jgi:apolipoprotein N-acyltransferase
MLKRLRDAWPVLASTALFSLAFPPFHLGLLVFVALVPWLVSLRGATPVQGFRSGLLFGTLFWLVQMYWLLPFVSRWTGSWLLAVLPWLLIPVVAMWYFGLAGWLIAHAYRLALGGSTGRGAPVVRAGWLVALPLVWAGIEALRAYIPALAFPWGLLATPLWMLPQVIQTGAWGTIFLTSAWVVLANVAVTEAVSAQQPRLVLRLVVPFVAIGLFSLARYLAPPEGESKVLTIGQLGVDMAFGPDEKAKVRRATTRILAAAMLQRSDLTILPEGLTAGGDRIPPVTPFPLPPPVAVLFGGQRGADPTFQSAFAYDGRWQYADKTRLVIFGEFVPLRDRLPFLRKFELPTGDLTAGDVVVSLEVAGIRAGPVICFEALFPNVAHAHAENGAELLAVMSIDDWFLGTPALAQIFAGSVFRAVENGLPLARSASMGHTAAIDARGRVIVRAPLGEFKPMRVEMELPRGSDAFPYRDLFPWVCGAACLLVALCGVRAGRRPRAGDSG